MSKMTSAATRHYGKIFDQVANEYDQSRPSYQQKLIDRACQIMELKPGDQVLEIGCGSGQLTRALVEKGLHVTALEPGPQLISLAEKNVKNLGKVHFINARFEDAKLLKGHYKGVFCASAFHWINPDVSWQKTTDILIPGGTLALIQYFGLKDPRTNSDLKAQLTALQKVAPEFAASWPEYFEIDEIMEEIENRQKNISEVWSWLGDYDLARNNVSHLFNNLQIAAAPILVEQTADELIAVIRTFSFYSRLTRKQQTMLDNEYAKIYKKLGRPMRSSTVNILITASAVH